MAGVEAYVLLPSQPNEEMQNYHKWLKKLVDSGVLFMLVASQTFCGDQYKSVYTNEASQMMPIVACMALVSFLAAKLKTEGTFGTVLTGIGFFCTNVLVFLASLPKAHPIPYVKVAVVVVSAVPLIVYYEGVKSGGYPPAENDRLFVEILTQSWTCFAVSMFVIVGAEKVKCMVCVRFLTVYSVIGYMLIFLALFLDSTSPITRRLVWVAAILQLPIAVTSIIGDTYPDVGVHVGIFVVSLTTATIAYMTENGWVSVEVVLGWLNALLDLVQNIWNWGTNWISHIVV